MSGTGVFLRRSIKYDDAERNLLMVLFGFAISVLATRYLLEATGYPQIASGDFHVAHVLWGGLLLFASSLLLLIWRGTKIHWLSSLLTGIGFGLFIDEVGKFITKSNDYFYPLAAPIIYAFFLMTVFIYSRVRGLKTGDAPADLYGLLDVLERGFDPNGSTQEKVQVKLRLRQIARESPDPRASRLASSAIELLETEDEPPKVTSPGLADRWRARLRAADARWISGDRLKVALIIGFIYLALRGIFAAVGAFLFTVELSHPAGLQRLTTAPWAGGTMFGMPRILLLIGVLILEALIGCMLLTGAGFIMTRRLRRGLWLGYWGLLFSLTTLYLPVLYFKQFEVVVMILLQFCLLLGVIRYRSRYLNSEFLVQTPT